jgi:hypothetical protein
MIYLESFKDFRNITIYDIQIPPNKEKSIELIIKNGPDVWFINDEELSDKEIIKKRLLEDSELTSRHEALHVLQELNIPDIFKNSNPLEIKSSWFNQLSENNFSIKGIKNQKKFYDYFTLEHEIMAWAFSYILIKKKPDCRIKLNGEIDKSSIYEENADKIYQSIGDEYYEKFKSYCDEYDIYNIF